MSESARAHAEQKKTQLSTKPWPEGDPDLRVTIFAEKGRKPEKTKDRGLSMIKCPDCKHRMRRDTEFKSPVSDRFTHPFPHIVDCDCQVIVIEYAR